jgi:hypothetical protein
MTYVFIFTGEFGYEILNWNGVVRKWVQDNKKQEDTVIICSRQGLELIYEMADYYIDISEIPAYTNSIADCYCSYIRDDQDNIVRNGQHQQDILLSISQTIEASGISNATYIYSPQPTQLHNCVFGHGGIYDAGAPQGALNLQNNIFKKFDANLSHKQSIESEIGISLDEPFILCQTAARDIVRRDTTVQKIDNFIKLLSHKIPVICLGFDSGKKLDSTSTFNEFNSTQIHHYKVTSLDIQSCLIHYASKCVFFTEGDFRSHIYLPPLFGKDVLAIASKQIFEGFAGTSIKNAPIDFWNTNVWNFGGKIIPFYYESLQEQEEIEYSDIINSLC